MTKTEAREYIKGLKARMTEEEIRKKSERILNKLLMLPEFVNATNILTYVSYNQEVDTFGLIKKCLNLGKNVFVPKVYGKEMKFHKLEDLGLLKKGKYGILEPDVLYKEEWNNLIGVMIMPGLAFGRDFSRVGYGGGFYDRYLEAHGGLATIALCFQFQVFDSIEVESFDYRPEIIVSDEEIIRRI